MSLKLHVWGPALDLPSIDPECLAAIGYFRHIVPRGQWTLIASNDASVSQLHSLPALSHGDIWISGYANIMAYLSEHCGLSTDNDLTPPQRADSLACTSYLVTRGSALLALLLYVSPTAWVEVTRPAYSKLLTFPLTWTVAPAMRSAAVEKVERLGLGHLATAVEEVDASSDGGATTTATGFLRLPGMPGPSRTMQPEQTSAIRLHSMADEFFFVLARMRGDNTFFLRDERPSSVDFLVHAFLRLMVVPTPQPFLRKALEQPSHERLQAFGRADNSSLCPSGDDNDLPWQDPPAAGIIGILGKFADGALGHIPGLLGESWTRSRIGGVRTLDDDGVRESAHDTGAVTLSLATVAAGLAAVGTAAYYRKIPALGAPIHRWEAPKTRLQQFGEAGALLGGALAL